MAKPIGNLRSFSAYDGIEMMSYQVTIFFLAGPFFLLTLGSVIRGWWKIGVAWYCITIIARVFGGHFLNRMGDVATVNEVNGKYHRFVVLVSDLLVAMLLMGRLGYDCIMYRAHGSMYIALVVVIALYAIAARFTRSKTFGARMSSTALTIMLVSVIAQLAGLPVRVTWPVLLLVTVISWLWLRRLQRRFGWETR